MTDSAKAALFFLLAIALYGLAVHDAAESFRFLPTVVCGLVLILALAALAWRLRGTAWRREAASVWLLAGVALALLGRGASYERLRLRSPAEWATERETDARATAERLQQRFTALCQSARAQVRDLAHFPAVDEAARDPTPERRARLFDVLASRSLPRAHALGEPGLSVYGPSKRPLAWSGENVGLLPREVAVTSTTRVVERSTETHLVVTEAIPGNFGTVAIEIPLTADRRIGDPYLLDFDALSTWAGRTVSARFAESSAERAELNRAVRQYGRFQLQQGLTGGPLWSAALGCDETSWLVRVEIPQEPDAVTASSARERWSTASAVALALALVMALTSLIRRHAGRRGYLLGLLAAIWVGRFVLLYLDVPLGLGLDLDNPAHFASSVVYGLARSPADFLLTMVALAASSIIVAARFWSAPPPSKKQERRLRLPAVACALLVLTAATAVLREVWLISSLDLNSVALVQVDSPRAAMQIGLLFLACACSLLAYVILSRVEAAERRIARPLLLDGLLVAGAAALLAPSGNAELALVAGPLLLAAHAGALLRSRLWPPSLTAPGPYRRMFVFLVLLVAVVAALYPSLLWFEDRTVRSFVETTVAPSVVQYQDSQLYVIAETARAIDRAEREGVFGSRDQEELAYRLWVGSELAVSAVSSTVEVVDAAGELVSRFSLNFPWVGGTESLPEAPHEWIVEERRIPGAPEHPGFYLARRSFSDRNDSESPSDYDSDAESGSGIGSGEVRFRVAFDWRNLPFVSTSNPYLHLFRTAGVETSLRFPYQELELSVFSSDGSAVFSSVEGALRLGGLGLELLAANRGGAWYSGLHEDRRHNTYLFSDETYLYAVSYPRKSALTVAAELAAWMLLATSLGLVALWIALASGIFSPRDLWRGLSGSFYGKLYVAFGLIALVPLVSLAFFLRGVVARQLERDAEQEGTSRARVVARLVAEALPSDSIGGSMLTDGLLESIGAITSVDVDVYYRGELMATSKPELVASGLLRPRVRPETYRDLVVERLSHSRHRQALGDFEYLVASVPLALDRTREPLILSVPLASRQPEIDLRIETLNQAVLLAALGFALAAAWVAHSLAQLIAGPIAELTEATHHVAEGELDVELRTASSDEIGRLFKSFTQMTADLKQQRNDLERTKKLEAWAEMARQIAHEIKNPLTPIQLSTEHLRRVFHDPDVDFERVLEDCSGTILEQVKTLRQISMEFSTFASPEPLLLEPTDVGELVRESFAPYAKTPPEGISFDLESSDELPEIAVDRRLIKRTLVNLIENAIHAVGGRGRVAVRVEPSEAPKGIAIVVGDDGAGVDPDIKARVFEPYFSTRAAGTGLGLAIAKKVVEDHGGTIDLESAPGEGTEVTIRLPMDPSPPTTRPV